MQPRTAALAVGGVAASLCAAVLSDPVQPSSCEITDAKVARILELPFREFDQNPSDGWRPYYASRCYKEAAHLLTEYISLYPERVEEHYMLPFHAGQMFAMIGEYDKAVDLMRQGYSQRSSAIIDWNAFVDANIAFLENNHEMLVRMRERIAKQPIMTEAMGAPDWAIGKKMNLDVVDGFIACFDKAYSVAYEDECRARGGE